MKRSLLVFILAVSVLLLPIAVNGNYWDLDSYPTTIYTSHHTSASVYRIVKQFTPEDLSRMDEYCDITYANNCPTTTRLRSANGKYNCHSYAWLSTSQYNDIWIGNEGLASFISDATLVTGSVSAGNIVVYCDSAWVPQHSAVITSALGGSLSNAVLVSKWGDSGLYSHAAYVGHPYVRFNNNVLVFSVHNAYYSDNGATHTTTCSCGISFSQGHLGFNTGPTLYCPHCGHVTYLMKMIPELR